MKPGETIAETAVREVKEETGIDVEVVSLVGIYSNPQHVVEYSDGEVRQQFSVCFVCRRIGGELATSDETSEVGYFSPDETRGYGDPPIDPAPDPALPRAGGPSPTSAERPPVSAGCLRSSSTCPMASISSGHAARRPLVTGLSSP